MTTEQDDRADDIAIATKIMGYGHVGWYQRKLARYSVGQGKFEEYFWFAPWMTGPEWDVFEILSPSVDANLMYYDHNPRPVPRYYDEIQAAWLVVDKLIELGWQIRIDYCNQWRCQFDDKTGYNAPAAYADTPAKAICAAALMTIPKEKRDERNAAV